MHEESPLIIIQHFLNPPPSRFSTHIYILPFNFVGTLERGLGSIRSYILWKIPRYIENQESYKYFLTLLGNTYRKDKIKFVTFIFQNKNLGCFLLCVLLGFSVKDESGEIKKLIYQTAGPKAFLTDLYCSQDYLGRI
jgi:hypothetical protein